MYHLTKTYGAIKVTHLQSVLLPLKSVSIASREVALKVKAGFKTGFHVAKNMYTVKSRDAPPRKVTHPYCWLDLLFSFKHRKIIHS